MRPRSLVLVEDDAGDALLVTEMLYDVAPEVNCDTQSSAAERRPTNATSRQQSCEHCAQGIITAPSTMQVLASQYQIGFDQGKAAADYVAANLGGNAQVLYFNLDTVSPQLKIRHRGVLEGLETSGGGIEVVGDLTVADISTTSSLCTGM